VSFHRILPSATLSATRWHLPSPSPIVKTVLPEWQTLEKPTPMPLAFHASEGPEPGHCLRSPVSWEWPLRFGPRNWFQSRDGLASLFVAWNASPRGPLPATARTHASARTTVECFIRDPAFQACPLTLRRPGPFVSGSGGAEKFQGSLHNLQF